MSQVITFYSYKGGVGRSLALVNVATLLSKWGKKVLMIDWDLEAPGLENFFEPYLQDINWKNQKGVLDFLWAKQKKEPVPWQDWVLSFSTKVSTTPLNLLVSGKSNGDYSDQLRAFNVSQFYKKHDGAHVIESFRKELQSAYDYVLIDSRTGVTDFGGICTIQMPDILVMLLTATEQGLNGTVKIAEKAQNAHAALPFDREKLLIIPVPARIDQSEYTLTQEWLNKIATKLKPHYEDWVPAQIDINEFMRLIKIPYIPYFSYGEKLPVIEQGVSDPAGLGYAYENLAMVTGRSLEEIDKFVESRELYLEEISGQTYTAIKKTFDPLEDVKISIFSYDKEIKWKIRSAITSGKIEYLEIEEPELTIGMTSRGFANELAISIQNAVRDADIPIIVIDNHFVKLFEQIHPLTGANLLVNVRPQKHVIIPLYFDVEIFNHPPSFLDDRHGYLLDNRDLSKDVINQVVKAVEYVAKKKRLSKPAAMHTGGITE